VMHLAGDGTGDLQVQAPAVTVPVAARPRWK
jgi:hypothetical protein